MHIEATDIAGLRFLRSEPVGDARGLFVRTFCAEAFQRAGLRTGFAQHSMSVSTLRGTLRGMHFQLAPHTEVKVVSCIDGVIHDVILDLRPRSQSYLRWQAFELRADEHTALYVPAGCAHGFQTLTDDVRVSYLISEPYAPVASRGVRHDDSAFRIEWPLPVTMISERDATWPSFRRLIDVEASEGVGAALPL